MKTSTLQISTLKLGMPIEELATALCDAGCLGGAERDYANEWIQSNPGFMNFYSQEERERIAFLIGHLNGS